MKRSTIFFSISLMVIFSMLAGLTTITAQIPTQPEVELGQPGLSYRYTDTLGETGFPYLEDSDHINYPWGIGTDGDNIWIGEIWSGRALKFSSDGTFLMQIGTASFRAMQNIFQVIDVGVDNAGNIWLVDSAAHHILKYDPAGDQIGELGEMWNCSAANDRFCNPQGIAFDTSGNIYVPDSGNARLQILDNAGGYLTTIGQTGVPGLGNDQLNEPEHIAIYENLLYIADSANQRIQIFDISTPLSPSYVATLGEPGVPGDDNDHFACPNGVSFDSTNIYIADACNNRVQVFDRAARTYAGTIGSGPGQGNNEFDLPTDVVVDSAGNIYVADENNSRVQQFDSDWVYVRTYGTTRVPYLTDAYHYNIPLVSTDTEDNVLITEEWGHRLIKLDPAGSLLWTFGEAGVSGWDNEHFSAPARAAADGSGNIYVPEAWNSRVQVISPEGSYLSTLGTGYGQGDFQFNGPSGVAIGSNDLIYVADNGNQRVQIFDISVPITPTYVATIGETGVCGADNDHLCQPSAVALDTAGNIYVADSGNNRLQKFDSNRVWQMTIGTGMEGSQFDQFISPFGIEIDAQGRIFVSDAANNRVQVFDSTGAYLTTIGGLWGTNSSQFITASSVAVDSKGNVYVSDQQNSRIQKYASGAPGWKQVNINGFGNPLNQYATDLETFDGDLYASVSNWSEGATVWRTGDGYSWSAVSEPGFTSTYTITNRAIIDMTVFDGHLYAGTGWAGFAGQLWRTPDGSTWQPVTTDGFGDPGNTSLSNFTSYGNMLYAGTQNLNGAQIWRSSTGDEGSWEQVVTDGLGSSDANGVTSFYIYQDMLYAALQTSTGGDIQVWRTSNGTDWEAVVTDGFGYTENVDTGGFVEFGGLLYLGTYDNSTGAQIWRSDNGTVWTQVMGDGFGDINNVKVESLFVYKGEMFAVTYNFTTGAEVWKSGDGLTWQQVNPDGFGDSNNFSTLWSVGTLSWRDRLYISTYNGANGGEVWQYASFLYLPIISH